MHRKMIGAGDGSDAADRALIQVKMAAPASRSPPHAVYCDGFTMPGTDGGSFPVRADEEEVQAKTRRQVAERSRNRLSATLKTAGGTTAAAHVITEIAARERADLIVSGAPGRTAVAGVPLDSVTQPPRHIAPCPVLAVPPPWDERR